MKKIWLAEFVGTFFMVFLGCGVMIAQELHYIESSYAAIVFGAVVALMIALFGSITRAHFNPAVTVGFFVLKKIDIPQLLIYWSAEFAGAITASALHFIIFGAHHSFGMNLTHVSGTMTFSLEVLGTSLLMGVISVAILIEGLPKSFAPLAIGTCVAIISYFIGPLSGGSFNPARTLAPALFTHHLSVIPLYFSATIIGSMVPTLMARKLINNFKISA